MEEVGFEVGAECVDALRSTIARCSDGELHALAAAVAAVLTGVQREDAALDAPVLEALEVDVIKALYSALACLFAEAAKRDATGRGVGAFLRARCGASEAHAGVVAGVFADAKERLRAELARTGEFSSVARLKGVDWRLEYRVDGAERDLLYHVVLKTAERNESFVCSVEQLQDLVVTLKDACKAVERVVHQA